MAGRFARAILRVKSALKGSGQMRRIAFIVVMALGFVGSGWFVAQPAAEPPSVNVTRAAIATPKAEAVASSSPTASLLVPAALAGDATSVAPAAPVQAATLQQALGAEACPSETEALNIVSRVISTWEFGQAARAIELVSIPHQNCDSVRAALARSRGAAETTSGWWSAPRPDDDRASNVAGDGFAVGGDSGPGYRG